MVMSHAIWKKDATNKTKIMELSIPRNSAHNYLTSGMRFGNSSHQQIRLDIENIL